MAATSRPATTMNDYARNPADAAGWIAPASTGAFAPPPPPGYRARPERREPTTPTEVLDELAAVVPGARGALLASVDGFAIARSNAMPDEAAHAAMLAAAVGLAHQLVTIGGGSELRQLVVDHDEGLLLLWPIGSNRVLSMLTTSNVDQARLRTFVRSRARLLTGDR